MASLVFYTLVLALHAPAVCEMETAKYKDPHHGKRPVDPLTVIYEPNTTPTDMTVKTIPLMRDGPDPSRLKLTSR